MTKLQKKFPSPSFLPAEYGGEEPVAKMAADWADHLEAVRPGLVGQFARPIFP